MPHKQYIHRPTVIKDIIITIVANMLCLIVFTQVDLLEWLYHLSRDYEQYEIDELFPLSISIGVSLLIFSYRRITELGLMAKTLEQMSLIDPLTGLPNRRAGQIRLVSWCDKAQQKGDAFAVYQIDLDEFKKVNDLYGQAIGDEALKYVAQRLNSVLPKSSLLCRWLDDNFLVVVKINAINNPHEFAHVLQDSINGKVLEHTMNVTTCIGYKIWQTSQTVEDVLHDTEDALIHAKHSGRNQIKGN